MLCDLDTIEIEKSGCKLVSIKRKPHTCEETQNYDDVVEQYIEPVDIDDVGNSVDEVFPQAEQPTSSFKVRGFSTLYHENEKGDIEIPVIAFYQTKRFLAICRNFGDFSA